MKHVLKTNRDGSEQILIGKVIWKEKPARKRDRRIEWQFSLETLRLREIEAVIRSRHGNGIPDPAGTDDVDSCHAYLRAVAMTPGAQDLVSWAKVWAPWANPTDLDEIGGQRERRKRMIGADAVAKLLFVTMDERTALGLKTIGACDRSTEDRKKLARDTKRARDRAAKEKARREEGRVARASYEAESISRLKPWLAEGISRRTWERRRDASLSRVEEEGKGDTPASKPDMPLSVQHTIGQSRVAGLVVGLGDHPPAELQEAAPHGSCDMSGGQAA
ncbi:hypothetical protein R1521_32820 [Rhizobium brockwellii]|uniref:Integrase n=1 Tax=Rhizobium brockwellii TaxID=3019932 RepID=A0ABU3YX77_9HYPH|nr:hypothetical protein [Rhizobium brockwellii]MDV4183286.1 hypothetical protein [Rhizobium brockwellii]MDV4190297.1 hypothetical protein [Rhizobium brockwellii]